MSSPDAPGRDSHEPYTRSRSDLKDTISSKRPAAVSGEHSLGQFRVVPSTKSQWGDSSTYPTTQDQKRAYESDRRRRRERSRSIKRSDSIPVSSSATYKSREERRYKENQMDQEGYRGSRRHHNSSSAANPSSNETSTLQKRSRGDRSRKIIRPTASRTASQDRLRPLLSPSALSVLSTFTGVTESSSGSNTTITQRAYDWPKESQKSPLLRHRSRRSSEIRSVRPKFRPRHSRTNSKESIDVFRFLESDAAGNIVQETPQVTRGPSYFDESVASMHEQPIEPLPITHGESESRPMEDEIAELAHLDQLHSDSGVSVGGESPEFKRRTNLRYHASSVEADPMDDMAKDWSGASPPTCDTAYPFDGNMVVTPPYHDNIPNGQPVPGFLPELSSYSAYYQAPWMNSPIDPPTPPLRPSGYDLLASNLSASQGGDGENSEDCIVPLYRRFEPLHHRVLLHLQDEISELEEQLERLDECIAQSQPYLDDLPRPASRREDIRFGDNLRYQRMDLLGRICVKLASYNQALQAYTSIGLKAETATDGDIRSYKEWLLRHQAIAKPETEFLDHASDLFCVRSITPLSQEANAQERSSRNDKKPHDAPRSLTKSTWDPKHAIGGPAVVVLLTLAVFLAIPTLLGRLAILVALASGGALVLGAASGAERLTERENAYCIGAYVGVMAVLACVVQ